MKSQNESKLELLLELSSMLSREVALDEILNVAGSQVAAALGAERATVWLVDAETQRLRSRVAVLPETEELSVPMGQGVVGHVVKTGEVATIDTPQRDTRWLPAVDRKTGYRTRSILAAPIPMRAGPRCGVIQVLNKRHGRFTDGDAKYVAALAEQLGRAIDYTSLSPRDASGVRVRGSINHLIGSSPCMQRVHERILLTASSDAAVLLTGETGTGKGVAARAIHANSQRRNGPLVTVDCTTLPSGLVESELFGRERGAFTGADQAADGKVEMARGGTLFIDEIGELPLSLQGKLLRLLQERQYERVGGTKTLDADIRVVCATNRDLEQQVAERSFRADLYYRIRVVDISMPALKERGPDEIRHLADHFLTLYARKHKKRLPLLAPRARRALATHPFPGNVRELEHAVERAVVLGGDVIDVDDLGLRSSADVSAVSSLADATRSFVKHRLRTLGGNRSATAKSLNISRNRLARILGDETEV